MMEEITEFIASLQLTKKQLSVLRELTFLLLEKGAIGERRIWEDYQRKYTKNPKRHELGVSSMKEYLEKIVAVIAVNEGSDLELTAEGKLYADFLLEKKRGTNVESVGDDRVEGTDAVVKETGSVSRDAEPVQIRASSDRPDSSASPNLSSRPPDVGRTTPAADVTLAPTSSTNQNIESYIQSLKMTENQLVLLVELTILIHSHGPVSDIHLWDVYQREYSKTPNRRELSVANMKDYLDKIGPIIAKDNESAKMYLTTKGERYAEFLMQKILNGTMNSSDSKGNVKSDSDVKEKARDTSAPKAEGTGMTPVWNQLPQTQFAGPQMRPVFQFGDPRLMPYPTPPFQTPSPIMRPGQAAPIMGPGQAAPQMRPGQAAPIMGPGQTAPPIRPGQAAYSFLGASGQPVTPQGAPLLRSVPRGPWDTSFPYMGAPVTTRQLPGAAAAATTGNNAHKDASDSTVNSRDDAFLRGLSPPNTRTSASGVKFAYLPNVQNYAFPTPPSPELDGTEQKAGSEIPPGFSTPAGRDSNSTPSSSSGTPVASVEATRIVKSLKLTSMQSTLLAEVTQLLHEKGRMHETTFSNEYEKKFGKQPKASPNSGVKMSAYFKKISKIVAKDNISRLHLTAEGQVYAESLFGKRPGSNTSDVPKQDRTEETVKPEVKRNQIKEMLTSMHLSIEESEALAELALLLHEKGAIEEVDISYEFQRKYKKQLRVGSRGGMTLHDFLQRISRIVALDANSAALQLTPEGVSYVESLIGGPKEGTRFSSPKPEAMKPVWSQLPSTFASSNMTQNHFSGMPTNTPPPSSFPPLGHTPVNSYEIPSSERPRNIKDGAKTKLKPKYRPMDGERDIPPGGEPFLLEDVLLEGSDDPQNVSRERLEAMALKCIDTIAEQGEFVTPRRVEIMLCQQLKIRHLGETKLRLRRGVEDLKSVQDLSRKIGQVEAHITASVALRNVNTLSDALEGLREGIPDKRPYDSLRLGPITKNPVVQSLFCVPSGCDVIDISCIDVYTLLRDYTRKNGLWSKPVDLQEFMKHLMEEYGVEDVYTLGVKIRSIALCMQNIKRAQRQEAESVRGYFTSVQEKCKSDLMSAYTSLRTKLMMKEDQGYTARAHYLTQEPADVIMDVMGKFKYFLQTARDLGVEDLNKLMDQRVVEQLEKQLFKTKLVKDLFKFSVVVSNEEAIQSVREFLEELAGRKEEAEMRTAKKENIPRNEIVTRLLQYLESCFKTSQLSLKVLKDMETKCAEHFKRDGFLDLGHESFLEFLLKDSRIGQILEENGGVTLGGGSHKMASSLYRPSLNDIVELVLPIGELKSEELVEIVACRHYRTEKFSHLGLGPVKLVLDRLERVGGKRRNVVNQTGLCHDSKIVLLGKNRYGIFGQKSVDEAVKSLQECPLLEDLGSWTQWDLVFAQQHGSLKDFVEKHGGHGHFELNGEHCEKDLAALELEPGKLIRLTSLTDDDKFREIVANGKPRDVCGHLVSLIVMRGFKSAGMALLANVISAHLHKLCAVTPGAPPCGDSKNPAVEFVRDCLCFLPLMFCEKIADEAFIVPLSRVLGKSESKTLLSRSCTTFKQMNRLAVLGHFLGIDQWQSLFQKPIVNLEADENEMDENGPISELGTDDEDVGWPSEDETSSEAETDDEVHSDALSDGDYASDVTSEPPVTETISEPVTETAALVDTTAEAVESVGNEDDVGSDIRRSNVDTGNEDVVDEAVETERQEEVVKKVDVDETVVDVVETTVETVQMEEVDEVMPDDSVTAEEANETADDVTSEDNVTNEKTPEIANDVTLYATTEGKPEIANVVTLKDDTGTEQKIKPADDVTPDNNAATEEKPEIANDVGATDDMTTSEEKPKHARDVTPVDDTSANEKMEPNDDVTPDNGAQEGQESRKKAEVDTTEHDNVTGKSEDAGASDVTTDKEVETEAVIPEPIDESDLDLDLDLSPNERKCKKVIETIRREEFGIGVKLDDIARRLFQTQQAKLKRSLKRLSEDLYTKDTHFVLELVQNADDNSYEATCPSMQFVIEKERITVLNNEVGFQANQTKALCDVGNSTKPKNQVGFIGQKGIGFKSVFRVTDRPEIHSNGYHFCFDMGEDEIGYILPHWIEEGEVARSKWQTRIVLPLKLDIKRNIHSLVNRFRDIHPSLLLFLHRLKSLTVENKISGNKSKMVRRDLGNKIIEIKHNKVVQSWLVVRQRLDVSKLQIKCKGDVLETEIALAFAVGTETPQKQSVFAFLPLRDYGFRFVIQGDFDLPSSREDLDCDSAWNQWLRKEIAPTFVGALSSFRTIEDDPIAAVKRFLMFVPREDEIMDFFKPVARAVFTQLSSNEFIPNTDGRPKLPSQLVAGSDSFIRLTFDNQMLERYLNLSYIHPDVVTDQNRPLLHDLGVKSLTNTDLLCMIRALSLDWREESNESTLLEIARILVCIQRSLDDLDLEDTTLESLKEINIIPDCQNRLVSLATRTVFFPFKGSKNDFGRMLANDLTIVDARLLQSLDNVANSQIQDVLEKLGVRQITVRDVIEHHILPTYRSGEWEKKPRETLKNYVIFLHEFQQEVIKIISFLDLSAIIQLSTNQGLKNPTRHAIHFTPHYRNQVDLRERFPCYKWCLLDHYPVAPGRGMGGWREFFVKLNVIDLFAVRKVRKEMSSKDLKETIWKDNMLPNWGTIDVKLEIFDWESEELTSVIEAAVSSPEESHQQVQYLFELLAKEWRNLARYEHVVMNEASTGHPIQKVESSFAQVIRSSRWVPGYKETSENNSRLVRNRDLYVAKDLYSVFSNAQGLLSFHVPYLDLSNPNIDYRDLSEFLRFLEIKDKVTLPVLKTFFLEWIEETEFTTTAGHLKNVYTFFKSNMIGGDLQELFCQHKAIFVPQKPVGNKTIPVCGKFHGLEDVCWNDPSNLFTRYKEEIELEAGSLKPILFLDRHSSIYDEKPIYYIRDRPTFEMYMDLLEFVCTYFPECSKKIDEVLQIYHQILTSPDMGSYQRDWLKEFDKRQVIPTRRDVYVRLADFPMLPDNDRLEKLFSESENVHFLDLAPGKQAKRNRKKDHSIEHQSLQKFFVDSLKVRPLSECYHEEIIPEGVQAFTKLQDYFHHVVGNLQKFIHHRHEDVYELLNQKDIVEFLGNLKFYSVGRLDAVYTMKYLRGTVKTESRKCIIQENDGASSIVYVHKDAMSDNQSIQSAMAEFFSCGDETCADKIHVFLMTVHASIDDPRQNMTRGLKDYKLNKLPEKEAIWEVKEAVVYRPPPPPPPPPAPPEAAEPVPEAAMTAPVLRSWPPQAPGHGNRSNQGSGDKSTTASEPVFPKPPKPDRVDGLPEHLQVKDDTLTKKRFHRAPESGPPSEFKVRQSEFPELDGSESGSTATSGGGDGSFAGVRAPGPRRDGQPHDANRTKEGHGEGHARSGQGQTPSGERTQGQGQTPSGERGQGQSKADVGDKPKKEASNIVLGDFIQTQSDPVAPRNDATPTRESPVKVGPLPMTPGRDRPQGHGNRAPQTVRQFNPDDIDDIPDERVFYETGNRGEVTSFFEVRLDVASDQREIGRHGEDLVYKYLQARIGQSHNENEAEIISAVKWVNESHETGLPFDIELRTKSGGDEEIVRYIEVKSTMSETKMYFESSVKEVMFANEQRERYDLYRVFSVGQKEKVKLIKLRNVAEALEKKSIRVFMVV